MDNSDNTQKIIMIVNGQPIEMCLKTLKLCNKRSQNLITSLKRKSMEQAHTMRLFWGDIIMLNIITNQLLQKVDSKSLSRILKPVESLQADLDEYRENRKDVANKLKDVIIVANNDTLPLDYSHELEKYYKSKFKSEAEEDEFSSIIGAAVEGMKALDAKNASKEKESIEETQNISKISNSDSLSEPKTDKPDIKTDNNIRKHKQSSCKTTKNEIFSQANYRADDDEENIDFSSSFSTKDEVKPENSTIVLPQNTDIKSSTAISNRYEHSNVHKKQKTKKSTKFTINKSSPLEENGEVDISELFESKKGESSTQLSSSQKTNSSHSETPRQESNKSSLPQAPVQNAQDELKKTEEAFASYGSIDLNSLFG